MVPSLEYLARSAVIEIAIRKNKSRYKQYILFDEHIDQYIHLINKKFPLIKTHQLGINTLLIFQ
jgi:hypothetical protein